MRKANQITFEFEHDTEETTAMLKRYCWKIDIRILLYATVLGLLNQSARSSIGVAKVVGLERDLGLHHNDFNIAASLFGVGYLSLEFFSNFALKKLGASKLIPTMGILWGAMDALQSVIHTKFQLYVMRLLLGLTECGFTAGIMLLISFFYPKEKITTRVAIFYLCSPLANVMSGLLGSGLSQINSGTIHKWQRVFMVEGILTILVAIPGYYLLQDHPEKCRFITDKERKLIVQYKEHEGTLGGSKKLTYVDIKQALLDWQMWVMTTINFTMSAGMNSIKIFTPELINELGFNPSQSQAMSALPFLCGAFTMLFSGRLVKICRGHWIASVICMGTILIGSIILTTTLNVPARMIGLCLVGIGAFTGLGIIPGWIVTANSRTVAHSTISSSLAVFIGSISQFVSSNVFLNSDAPRFVTGHAVNVGFAALGVILCVLVRVSMGHRNKKLEEQPVHKDNGFRFVY